MFTEREILDTNLKRISEGDHRPMHVSAAHYAWLGNALAHAEIEAKAAAAAMRAVVETAGGMIDGYPVGRHNILQRIRELVEKCAVSAARYPSPPPQPEAER